MNTDIIDKLRKILALANDKAATPGEMESAMAKAKELAIRYNIELAEISAADPKKGAAALQIEKNEDLRTSTRYARPYHRWILRVLEKAMGVAVLTRSHYDQRTRVISSIILIGEVVDVAMAKEIFPWLEELFPQLYRSAITSRKIGKSRVEENGFFIGLADGIISANRKEEQKLRGSDANKYALIVRSKEDAIALKQNELFPVLKKAGRNQLRADWEARERGMEEGSKIRLSQVGAGKNGQQLK